MAFKKHNDNGTSAQAPESQVATEQPAETAAEPAHILWGDTKLVAADLPDHAKHYLMQQGAIKVRSDVAGGLPKQHREAGKSKEESDAIIAALHARRLEAILSGNTVTRALGPRVTGMERMLRVVARERVVDKATRLGKEAPKGKAMLDIIEAIIKTDPRVKQIAELRMADDDGVDFPGM